MVVVVVIVIIVIIINIIINNGAADITTKVPTVAIITAIPVTTVDAGKELYQLLGSDIRVTYMTQLVSH